MQKIEVPREALVLQFGLGQIVGTPAALLTLSNEGESPLPYLRRHVRGDWGDLGRDDMAANDRALLHGGRIFSAYKTKANTKIWIITEADRSATTVLLPDDY